MNNLPRNLTLLSALLLGGCAIGPDYARPDITLPDTFQHEGNATKEVAIDAQWWKNFQDPLLTQSVQEALNNNYDLQSSRASVNALLGQFDQAKSALYPQINANASLDRKGVDNAAVGGKNLIQGVTSTYASSLSLASYEIDLFGKVQRANEAARALLLSGEYAAQTMKLSVASSVAVSYVKISSLQGQIDLARQNVSLTREIHEMNALKFKHGTIAETTLLQSLSENESAQASLSQLEAAKISEEAAYNLLLGKNPSSVTVTSLERIRLPEIPSALPSTLLTKRPDIAAAEQNLIAANARIGIARAAYFPSIKLTGMLGTQSLELTKFLSNPATIWDIAPSITLPIFTAGRIEGEIKTAEANHEQTLAAYKKTIVSAFNDTFTALGQTAKSKEQTDFQTRRLEAVKKALDQSKLRYRVGTIAYNDMLIVQQQWLQASQQALLAKQNSLIATVSLYKSLGGGWSDEQTPPLPDLFPAGR